MKHDKLWTDNPAGRCHPSRESRQLPTDSQQKGISRQNFVNSGVLLGKVSKNQAHIIKYANSLHASSEAAIHEMYIAESPNLSRLAMPIGHALRSSESALTLAFLGVNPHKRKNNLGPPQNLRIYAVSTIENCKPQTSLNSSASSTMATTYYSNRDILPTVVESLAVGDLGASLSTSTVKAFNDALDGMHLTLTHGLIY